MLDRRGFLKWLWSGLLVGTAMVGWPVAEAMASPRLTRYRLTPPGWPPGFRLTIAAIADIHACTPWMSTSRIGAICAHANAIDADLIVLLGDYAGSMKLMADRLPASDWAEAMSVLAAPLGVHAVLGNHDYWSDPNFLRDPDRETEAERALRAVGIPVYVNEAVRLEKDGRGFWLAGLGDQQALQPYRSAGKDSRTGLDDLPGTLAQVVDDDPVILLAHEPDIFATIDPRVSLTLSGHTHGGQVNLLGWTPVVPSRYGSRYVGGHIVENDRHLIVSRGLGCSGLPIRFGSWPEIVVIELG